MVIDLRNLPREIRDTIELKEQSDNTFYRFVEADYTETLWDKLAERADVKKEHSFIGSISGVQGVGKSLSGISMCCFLDPNFSVDKIFFSYDDLVNARGKLKTGDAVLVDEQSQVYGLDAHRIMVVISNLKEQLRKKSIHFIFCAPVLYEESKTSMYLLEVLFIDYETREAYAALKTREGMTLGHVRIPHPLKKLEDGTTLASKELIEAYQQKKDDHLERVLGNKNTDPYEQRARMVEETPLFKKAEKVYIKKMGYIPNATLVQIINKVFPEYNAGVVPLEIAGRIKLNKELSGEWEVAGKVTRKDRAGRK
jgi:hypothetical protein